MHDHQVVSHDEWVDARKQLLAREKEFTRLRDEMTREQRALPWEPDEADELVYNFGTIAPRNTQREGLSVFYKDDDGRIFHTYTAFARGIDIVQSAYNYLDLVPKGRDESPPGPFWVRRHDEY